MRVKRRRLFISLLVVALVGGWLLWERQGPPEPVYGGQPLGYWINQDHAYMAPGMGGLPVNVFTLIHYPQMDARAVPFLLKGLNRGKVPFQAEYAQYWPELPDWLRNRLPSPVDAAKVRANSAMMLGRLGEASPKTIQALLRMARRDGYVYARLSAIEALGRIGGRDGTVTNTLVKLMTDADPNVVFMAKNAYLKIDPASATKMLMDGLPDGK